MGIGREFGEGVLTEGQDFGGAHREHLRYSVITAAKARVGNVELPAAVPLAGPGGSKSLEVASSDDSPAGSLNDNVEPVVPRVRAGGEHNAGVALDIQCLLLGRAGGEM